MRWMGWVGCRRRWLLLLELGSCAVERFVILDERARGMISG